MSERLLVWREVFWPQPLAPDDATRRLLRLATDPHNSLLVLEVRGQQGTVHYLVGTEAGNLSQIVRLLDLPAALPDRPRQPVTTVRRLTLQPRLGLLDTAQAGAVATELLAALAGAARADEELVLQLVLGPRLAPTAPPPAPATADSDAPLLSRVINRSDTLDAGQAARKTAAAGFQAVLRIGVEAATPGRRQNLVLSLAGALRTMETPTAHWRLDPEASSSLGARDQVTVPLLRWPLRLTAAEATTLAGLPVSDTGRDLPGLPPAHPRLLPPAATTNTGLVVGEATAPGATSLSITPTLLRLTPEALLRHLVVTGPTGTGKSVLLEHLVLDHVGQGHGAVIIEPKGDLVRAVLAKIPEHRQADVVVLDPIIQPVVGLNPLSGGGSPEWRADAILHVFTDLFSQDIGPRSSDILHSALLTLAHTPGTSLTDIPRLLADAGFRARLVGQVSGDPLLAGFWASWENLTSGQQNQIAAPLMNKLRYVLLRPSVRAVIGQNRPKFDLAEVFTRNRILLVPLPVATLGAEGSALLGSLVVASLWNTAQSRTLQPPDRRRPVMVCLDEFQNYARLPDIADALVTSRSLGVGWVLAHQFLDQLPASMRSAVANVRSRVVFQLARDDAAAMANTTTGRDDKYELTPADFMALPPFRIYASLFAQGQAQPFASGRTLPPGQTMVDPERLAAQSAQRYGRCPDVSPTVPPATEPDGSFRGSSGAPVGSRRRQTRDQPVSDRSSARVESGPTSPACQADMSAQSGHASSLSGSDESRAGSGEGQP